MKFETILHVYAPLLLANVCVWVFDRRCVSLRKVMRNEDIFVETEEAPVEVYLYACICVCACMHLSVRVSVWGGGLGPEAVCSLW